MLPTRPASALPPSAAGPPSEASTPGDPSGPTALSGPVDVSNGEGESLVASTVVEPSEPPPSGRAPVSSPHPSSNQLNRLNPTVRSPNVECALRQLVIDMGFPLTRSIALAGTTSL